MTDVMREMIAQLMGAQREEEEGRRLPPYDHHSVCRAYLMECCPKELLSDTRLESFMPCRKMHEPAHKADYQRAQEKRDLFYDIEAFEALDEAVRVIDNDVDKIREKLRRETEQASDSQEYIKSQKILELNDKISQALVEVEKLGNEGRVQESMAALTLVEELKIKKRELEAELKSIPAAQQRLRVCDTCGAQLNILDHESRLADHYGGKMHLGMVEVREKWAQMKETIDDRRLERRRQEDKDRVERRAAGKRDSRERDRSRDRDHRRRDSSGDRRRDRDRSKSRSPRRSNRRSRSRTPPAAASSSKRSSRRDRSSSRDRDRGRRSGRH